MEEPYELPASRRRKKILSPTRLIVGSFFLVILVGTLLLLLPFSTRDGHIQLVDALFTATSATCVTGLIVFDTYTEFTWFGQLVILLLIQALSPSFPGVSFLPAERCQPLFQPLR